MESGRGSLLAAALFRPAALIALLFLSFLAASSFLASHHKFDLSNFLWYSSNTSTPLANEWPHHDIWEKLSGAPRLPYNRCHYANCPINIDWNHSQFIYPYSVNDACPFYFSFIHEDLAPWATVDDHYNSSDVPDQFTHKSNLPNTHDHHVNNATHQLNDGSNIIGISKEMLNNATKFADFRVVIKRGKLYVDAYHSCFQTRAIFTIWGLLQLLKFYPGLVPDVDMLFGCGDTPRVPKGNYKQNPPPPVFRYCSTLNNFDIPFPDWTFWGWPEVDLSSWDNELSEILKGENDFLWEQRRPTAFWKGNVNTGGRLRQELKGCNGAYYGAEIIHQDWGAAAKAHYTHSRLGQQCKNRFKIYVEGWGWSVSLKYILACDSPVLLVDPVFYDFFSRGLMPMKHFWPIGRDKLCDSIKFGVGWGNNNALEAEALGRSGRQFITKEVSMKHVYDYMLHALHEYAKLLRFEPTVGEKMSEVCVEEMVCQAPDKEKPLYEESMVRQASGKAPCFLAPRDKKLMEGRMQQRLSMAKIVRQAEGAGNWSAVHLSPLS